MDDICFGYLDNSAEIGNQYVADKCRQITLAHQGRIVESAPSYVTTTTSRLLNWAFTTGKRFLFIQKFGHVASARELQNSIEFMMQNGIKHMTYGMDHHRDSAAITDLKLNNPAAVKVDFPDSFWFSSRDLMPTLGTEQLANALYDYERHKMTLKHVDQMSYIRKHVRTEETFGVTIRDTESFRYVHTCAPVNNLYTIASGFKPILLLPHIKFTPATRVVYFDYSQLALVFRRLMVESWDGTNFLDYLQKLANNQHFQVTKNLAVAEASWKIALNACGGEREFKNLWDAYRKLPHHYLLCDLMSTHKTLLDAIKPDPKSYIFWDDCFNTHETHLNFPIEHVAERYQSFYSGVLSKCPLITMEGKDHWGNRVRNHLLRCNKY